MSEILKYDIAILGAGAGGLVVAAVAAELGKKVALIEGHKMGGDCLNYGCVPSKSLLAAAKAAYHAMQSNYFGVEVSHLNINFQKVIDHVNSVIDAISDHDSVERFTKLGVSVIHAKAAFIDKKTILAGDIPIRAKRFVIATGSSPVIPPIPGIGNVPFYTNETIFSLQEKPTHLIVIGAGPIGCELAQAFQHLGSKVTVLEAFSMMPRDEPELVHMLRAQLLRDGMEIFEGVNIKQITNDVPEIKIIFEKNGLPMTLHGSHLLLATGRKANIASLNLDKAKIKHNANSIDVNASLRTSNRRVYAVGDVVGGYQFTHIANYHASIVIKNILFKLNAKVDYRAIPWVTFTTPELAHAGLLEKEALARYPEARTIECPFDLLDRAQAEHTTNGKIKVIVMPNGRVLGASILAPCAGELIVPWIMLIQLERSLKDFSDMIIPYPTYSDIIKKVVSAFYKEQLYSAKTRFLVKLLSLFD